MATQYTVEAANLAADPSAVLALWLNNLPGYDAANARAKLQLGYLANPAGASRVLLLMAQSAQGPQTTEGAQGLHKAEGPQGLHKVKGVQGLHKAEGVQGLHARRFQFGALTLNAVALADLVVNAEHRSLGPALMLMRRSVEIAQEHFELTYGLPNERAAAVCARAGLRALGSLKRYAKPLASREKLGARISPGLAMLLAPLVDRALTARDAWRGAKLGMRLTCRTSSWNNPALDDIWAQRGAGLLLSQRSADMLRWRFDGARLPQSSPRWEICIAHDASSAVQGYVVWRQNAGFFEVGDFFVKNVSQQLTPMMLGFARYAKRHQAVSISVQFFGDPRVVQSLLAAGMQLRPEEAAVFIGAATPAELTDPNIWYLTAFDNDAD